MKTIKKSINFFLVALIFSASILTFNSCSNDDDSTEVIAEEEEEEEEVIDDVDFLCNSKVILFI